MIVCGGTAGVGPADFSSPSGLFVDENDQNTIYVADTFNQRIQQWVSGASAGKTVTGQTSITGRALNHLSAPKAIIVDANKDMFISDNGNNRIMRWTIGSNSGEIIAGDSTNGALSTQLSDPLGFCFDSDGSLFVAVAGNRRIQKFAAFHCKYRKYLNI